MAGLQFCINGGFETLTAVVMKEFQFVCLFVCFEISIAI
jgi:hypothetical protein